MHEQLAVKWLDLSTVEGEYGVWAVTSNDVVVFVTESKTEAEQVMDHVEATQAWRKNQARKRRGNA